MIMHSDYIATMDKQMKKWDADVDALAIEGKKAADQARTVYEVNLLQLRSSRAAAQKAFQQVSAASESVTAQMKEGLEGAWATMQKALEKISADLKIGAKR